MLVGGKCFRNALKSSAVTVSEASRTARTLENTSSLSIVLTNVLNIEADEQPPVQAAIDRLEGFRTELLHSMFGSKSND